jgi:hypothetical protein
LPSYPTPITAIACPSIGDGVEIVLEITISGDESPPKTNARAFDPASWWQLDPLQMMVRWEGVELGRRNGSDTLVVLLLYGIAITLSECHAYGG